MSTYKNIFKEYNTKENIPFLLLNRRVVFPEDESLPIYNNRYISSDTPWTILSYQIYNDISYWWILCALNPKNNMYYAKDGTRVKYVKPEYISLILNNLK